MSKYIGLCVAIFLNTVGLNASEAEKSSPGFGLENLPADMIWRVFLQVASIPLSEQNEVKKVLVIAKSLHSFSLTCKKTSATFTCLMVPKAQLYYAEHPFSIGDENSTQTWLKHLVIAPSHHKFALKYIALSSLGEYWYKNWQKNIFNFLNKDVLVEFELEKVELSPKDKTKLFTVVLPQLPKLLRLNLVALKLDNADMLHLIKALGDSKAEPHFMKLNGNEISWLGVERLSGFLKKMPSVQEMDLSSNKVELMYCHEILELFNGSPDRRIILSNNPFASEMPYRGFSLVDKAGYLKLSEQLNKHFGSSLKEVGANFGHINHAVVQNDDDEELRRAIALSLGHDPDQSNTTIATNQTTNSSVTTTTTIYDFFENEDVQLAEDLEADAFFKQKEYRRAFDAYKIITKRKNTTVLQHVRLLTCFDFISDQSGFTKEDQESLLKSCNFIVRSRFDQDAFALTRRVQYILNNWKL